MNIIIAGGGKVGSTLVRLLSAEEHDLTLIDVNQRTLESMVEQYDMMAVRGNCASMEVLLQAGIRDADLLIAVTGEDELNLLSCITARGLNPKLHTIARIRDPEYTEQIHRMQDLFGLSMTVNPEKQAAREIERLIKFPGFLRRDSFAKGRTEIVELRVDDQSRLKDVQLMDIYKIVKCRVLVCAVVRNGQAMIPGGTFVLRSGDRVFVTAPTSTLALLLKNLDIVTRRVRHCLLGGGGRVSYYLAQLLEKDGISVRILERDPQRCRELAELLPEAEILNADFSSRKALENAELNRCDAFLSLTGIDEMNMITSLYAASQGVRQVITKLGRTENSLLAGGMSLGSVVCPRELCGNEIVRYVRAMENQTGAALSVHGIADGMVEAMEFMADSHTQNLGVPLKELKLKANVLLASISHGGRVEIPHGDSMIQQGDSVVVVTTQRGAIDTLNDIFA